MARRCWVNLQCRGVLLIWIIEGQEPIAPAEGADGACLVIYFPRISFFLLLPCEAARYRLKCCLRGPSNPKQPTKSFRTHIWYSNHAECPRSVKLVVAVSNYDF